LIGNDTYTFYTAFRHANGFEEFYLTRHFVEEWIEFTSTWETVEGTSRRDARRISREEFERAAGRVTR